MTDETQAPAQGDPAAQAAPASAPEQNYRWCTVTNNSPGPRIFNGRNGAVIVVRPGETSAPFEISDTEANDWMPAHTSGDLEFKDAEAPETANPLDVPAPMHRTTTEPDLDTPPHGQFDAAHLAQPDAQAQVATDAERQEIKEASENETGPAAGDTNTEDSTDTETEPDDNDLGKTPDRVEHRGGGRYYGMAGNTPVTEAMTKDEADAYATEKGLAASA